MNIDNLTFGELKQISSLMGGKQCDFQPYEIGGMYQLRTVTHIITGKVLEVGDKEIVVTNAAWIADTGRYTQAVATAEYEEVEPYPADAKVIIGRGSIIDAIKIPKLPKDQK